MEETGGRVGESNGREYYSRPFSGKHSKGDHIKWKKEKVYMSPARFPETFWVAPFKPGKIPWGLPLKPEGAPWATIEVWYHHISPDMVAPMPSLEESLGLDELYLIKNFSVKELKALESIVKNIKLYSKDRISNAIRELMSFLADHYIVTAWKGDGAWMPERELVFDTLEYVSTYYGTFFPYVVKALSIFLADKEIQRIHKEGKAVPKVMINAIIDKSLSDNTWKKLKEKEERSARVLVRSVIENISSSGLVQKGAETFSNFDLDQASTGASSGIQTPGGIDFNAKNMKVKTSGEGLAAVNSEGYLVSSDGKRLDTSDQIPDTVSIFQNINWDNIQGFVPVIINIVPVTDFYGLLGLANPQAQKPAKEISKNEESKGKKPGSRLPSANYALRETETLLSLAV
jgi:hypothetical protein